jgi:trigger factor
MNQLDYTADGKVRSDADWATENAEVEYPIVKVEETEFCKLKVHYEGDPQVVNSKMDDAIASLRKIRVPGFRPGKAPDQAIKQRLRPQINQYIAREMASHAIDDIVFETDIKPIGMPKFSNVSIKGNKFSCDIELGRKPAFEVGNFKFEVPKPKRETDEEALAEKSLLNLRLRVGESEPYEESHVVEVGDQVTFSFVATIDGEPFDGSTVEGEMYTVGSNRWEGFDDKLLGMKAGETKEFDLKFEIGSLLGKTAHFTLTIHMGMKRKPHPINEDFYKIMGVENVEDLMTKLRSIAKLSIDRNEKGIVRSQVATKLIESNEFEVPKFMIEAEAKSMAVQQGLDPKDLTAVMEQAEKNVRLSLILDTIRENEPDSVLNDTEAQSHLAQHLASQGQDPDAFFNSPAAQPQIASLIQAIKDEFALQWVANQATLIE